MSEINIDSPCVILFGNGDIAAYSSEYSLSLYSELFIDNGNLDYAKIIDSNGNLFSVFNVNKIKNKNILPKYFVRYSKRIVQVNFKLDFIEKLDVAQMKEHIINHIKSNQKLLTNYQEIGLIQMIKGVDNYMEIIEAIGIE